MLILVYGAFTVPETQQVPQEGLLSEQVNEIVLNYWTV